MAKLTKKPAKRANSKRPAIGFHQAGLQLWNKALRGKKYEQMPRGFRAEFTAAMVKALGCTESSANTYVKHYARHGKATWDYQSQTAPRYKAAKSGKAAKAKNGSKIKYTKAGKAAAAKRAKAGRATA